MSLLKLVRIATQNNSKVSFSRGKFGLMARVPGHPSIKILLNTKKSKAQGSIDYDSVKLEVRNANAS